MTTIRYATWLQDLKFQPAAKGAVGSASSSVGVAPLIRAALDGELLLTKLDAIFDECISPRVAGLNAGAAEGQ